MNRRTSLAAALLATMCAVASGPVAATDKPVYDAELARSVGADERASSASYTGLSLIHI